MLGQFSLECRCHGNTVEHRVDRNARETLLFFQRNPSLLKVSRTSESTSSRLSSFFSFLGAA